MLERKFFKNDIADQTTSTFEKIKFTTVLVNWSQCTSKAKIQLFIIYLKVVNLMILY